LATRLNGVFFYPACARPNRSPYPHSCLTPYFKVHDGKTYADINNFDSGHNALAVLNANFDTFEIVGHFTEPQGMFLTENAVNRMPDGT
jgi:hypothetical protein